MTHNVENQYPRVVKRAGNRVAQDLVNKVFEVCDRKWRGVGSIPKSGYKLRYEFRDQDAERLFDVKEIDTKEPSVCISGLVLKGVKKPHDCPAFGKQCTPEHPLGATMVSAEGACAAYYAYGRHLEKATRTGCMIAPADCSGRQACRELPRENSPQMRREHGDEGAILSRNTPNRSRRCREHSPLRFEKGGRLFAMGNGGSLCDALHITVEFNHPIIEKRAAFPVIPLMTDTATMTAIGNDLDFSRVFVNQLRLLAAPGDVAMAFSTSGKSPNLIYALEAARELQMLTVAFAGKDGGRFPEVADYCFIVPSYSIHRIQEVHATVVHVVWDLVHIALGAEDVT